MFNTKFIAMKKLILLLFLASILVQPIFANTNNSDEKIELTPKIKKGDSWNMVTNAHDLSKYSDIPTSKNVKLASPSSHQTKTNWKVTCMDVDENSLLLKFKLVSLSEYDRLVFEGEDPISYYNNSDYPINLSEDHTEQINKILGKSFSFIIPFDANKKIELIENEFESKKLVLPVMTFQSKEKSYFSISYQPNSYFAWRTICD